jgi:hypothetical protein
MKAICTVFLLQWSIALLQAQEISVPNSIPFPEENPPQPGEINKHQEAVDNSRGLLLLPHLEPRAYAAPGCLAADPGYNRRQPLWKPAAQVAVITEQKIFLQLYLQDPQRQGRYN